MGRPCTSNSFCLLVFLFSICCSGLCTARLSEIDFNVGQTQSENTTLTRKGNSYEYDESVSSNIESINSVPTTQKLKYISSSKALAVNEPSPISHDSSRGMSSAFNKLSSVESASLSIFSFPGGSQSSDYYSPKDTQSARLTSSEPVMPLSVSSYLQSATSYATSSYYSEGPTSSLNATSVVNMTTSDRTLSKSSEHGHIVSSSQLIPTNSFKFLNVSLTSSYNARNLTTKLPIIASSSYNSSLTSMLPSQNTSAKSVLMTSSLMASPIETLSVSLVTPSSSWNIFTSVSFSVVSNASDIKPIAKTGCNVVLEGLANAMGQMTFCLLRYLRPIEVCAKCTRFHSKLRRYENLIHNTKDCEKELVLDYNAQYQAVRKMYKVQYDMWQDFECEKCYKERSDTNPSAAWIPKEDFLKSQMLIKNIMVCFANYSQSEILLPYPVMLNISQSRNGTFPNSGNMICTKCQDMYKKLRMYMKSIHIEGSAEKRWCADMVYGFNETRRVWGQFCVTHNEDQESIIALTCFFCFLPVVFYIGTKLHSDVKERKNESRVNYDSD